ncbi:leucyl aminopeptidase family protein [Serinibacter arcticus]|uniref:Probable cytosol aminopeptidase n=1 Tax=Serinibacter arcticus TaxID=1655435 RepID=A0A4Z1E6V1_9MICO|nr:M17 family peptidase N-terminal domain-containing protein [Serinibacter arcticus]TGO06193.1 Cytosol aminopeptidase PepA [Serinibacter arcticus]
MVEQLGVTLPGTEVLGLSLSRAALEGEWDAVAVPVAPGGDEEGVQPRAGTADAAAMYGIDLADLAELTGATGAAGDVVVVPLPKLLAGSSIWSPLPRRLVLVGVGDSGPAALRTAGAAMARAVTGRVLTTVGLEVRRPRGSHDVPGAAAVVEGALLATASAFRRKAASPPARLTSLTFAAGTAAARVTRSVDVGETLARGTMIARVLAATPADVATPAWIADRAVELAAGEGRLTVEVHDERWLAENGFASVIAVGAESPSPPRLVVVTYEPSTAGTGTDAGAGAGRTGDASTIAVVGKGITFDTGGLALKPRESMVPMKTDMTGAAVALATVVTAARLGIGHSVVAVLPLAENSFGGAAYRPGDVIRTWDGTSVEIGNTDAEGRMVLADALAWTADTLRPDVLVDVATLTGAATSALSRTHAALFTPQDDDAAALVLAGEAAGERVWRMPLVADYAAALHSEVADVSHVTTDPTMRAGAVTAALFLERFAHGLPWIHLDIAGPARSPKARHEVPQGATGFGVRLLVGWLRAR